MTLTKHGTMRMRQRIGITKKATQRIAERAFEKGLSRNDAKGAVRKWMDETYSTHETGNNMRIYGDKLFIFNNETLITVLQVPSELSKRANALQKKAC